MPTHTPSRPQLAHEQLKAEHDAAQAALKDSTERALASQEAEHGASMAALKETTEKSLASQEADHAQRLASIEEKTEKALTAQEAEHLVKAEAHAAELSKMKENQKTHREHLIEEHEETRTTLSARLDSTKVRMEPMMPRERCLPRPRRP